METETEIVIAPTKKTSTLPEQPEAERQTSEYLQQLREHRLTERHERMLEAAEWTLLATRPRVEEEIVLSSDPDHIAEHGTGQIDSTLKSPQTRLFINATEEFANRQPSSLITSIRKQMMGEEVPDSELEVQISEGVTLQFKAVSEAKFYKQVKVDEGVSLEVRRSGLTSYLDYLRQSYGGFNEEVGLILDAIKEGEISAYSNATFNFAKEPDLIINFIQQGKFPWLNLPARAGIAALRESMLETVYGMRSHYADQQIVADEKAGIYFDEEGGLDQVLIEVPGKIPGLYLVLRRKDKEQKGDLGDIDLQIGLEIDIEDINTELDYNGHRHEAAQPFIETRTAAELVRCFEATGLTLSQYLTDAFTETSRIKKRYGHGYSEITRQLAKLVNDRDRSLTEFFEGNDEQKIAAGIRNLSYTDSRPAEVVINILKGVVDRSGDSGSVKSLPVSSHRIEIRDGACKDAEVYIADGHAIEDSRVEMWRSTYQRSSVIIMEPVEFNGVLLPPGSLFAIEDDGYVFMRITSFSFDTQDALEAFGVQELENRTGRSLEDLRRAVRSQVSTEAA